jgi:lipid-A-disaccharide synthase
MNPARPLRLVLSAGETSGDQIGADLARALKARHPRIELAGLAGPKMQAAGVEPWYGLDALNVMGLSEVISHLPRLLRLRREYHQHCVAWQADAFVGIDAPDFNLGLARRLRGDGITAIHYVSPSVWAWRSYRIGAIARSLDLLLTLFPFEPALYRPHGLDARFVGHHLADELNEAPSQAEARNELGLGADAEVIALLPGSRQGELGRHARLIADTAVRLRQARPESELILLLADSGHRSLIDSLAVAQLEQAGVRTLCGQTRGGLRAADLAMAASGTVTLEAFLLGCPLVVYYRLAPSTYWLARALKLVKTRHVSLPNILTERELVPERLQQAATPERLSADALAWLDNAERRADYLEASDRWRQALAIGAGERAAEAILERLGHA